MTFKPKIWFPIAIGLIVVNVGGLAMAAAAAETWHATLHGVLAVAFGLWAQRLRRTPTPPSSEVPERLEALESEADQLRQELGETQERLDFAERMLAQRQEGRRVGPQP